MKKIWYGIMVVLAVGLFMTGCGENKEQQASDMDSHTGTEGQTELVEIFSPAEEFEDVPTVMYEYAEETEYPELAAFLAEYYQVPAEAQVKTRYYYNYIDMNEDGVREIFAIVIGDYTAQENGDPALLLAQEAEGSFSVIKSFDGVRTPVMISDVLTNGWHDIVYQVYGKDTEDGYLIWRYDAEKGYDIEATELLEDKLGIFGMEILANNLIDDMDKGRYMTLAPEETAID